VAAVGAVPGRRPGRLATNDFLLGASHLLRSGIAILPEALAAGLGASAQAEARRVGPADQPRGLSLLVEALGMWCGPALAEFAFEGFGQRLQARQVEHPFRRARAFTT